ncbi:MAG: DUF4157 domain-containing protein [Ornithinimicrobium sp.]
MSAGPPCFFQDSPIRGGQGTDPVPLAYLQRTAGNAAVVRMVSEGRRKARYVGPLGQPLDAGSRSRMEAGLGEDLSDVRVNLDSGATAREGASAFTVGSQIVIDPACYRPGTATGDGLLAHEVAHVVQQRESAAANASEGALEAETDRAAVAFVAGPAKSGGMLIQLRSALSLRRCSGCSDPERERLDAFRAAGSPERLEAMLRPATEEQIRRLGEASSSADALHADAVAWEAAIRRKDFNAVVELNGRSDPGFRTAYRDRVLELIMGGTTNIRVDKAQVEFIDFVRSSMDSLLGQRTGFRLITELLATGQTVNLRSGTEHTTEATDPEAARGSPADGRRAGSGSTITLNPELARNQVSLGGTPGNLRIIRLDPSMTVGHELIHALNNARGKNAAPVISANVLRGVFGGAGLVRDPITGEPQSAEELRTITGRTTYTSVRSGDDDGPPTTVGSGAGISENDLRSDAGLEQRASHFGATDTVTLALGAMRSVDDVVARYRLPASPLPPGAAAAIRSLLVAAGLGALSRLPADTRLDRIQVPSAGHVTMHIRFVLANPDLADQLAGLTVS